MGIIEASNKTFDINVPVLVIGAGACGCCAALAAHDVGAEVMILERDAKPSGSTSLSGGQVPGAASHLQIKAGVNDRPDILANDLIKRPKIKTIQKWPAILQENLERRSIGYPNNTISHFLFKIYSFTLGILNNICM